MGRFELLHAVGRGGNGVVWQGRHVGSGRPVAIKVFHRRNQDIEMHSLHAEAVAIAKLDHPHIAALLDFGVDEARDDQGVHDAPYLVMELASGGDLLSLPGPCSYEVVSDVVHSLLLALSHAHARGVVHCDLKPANVLLCSSTDDRPGIKLADFGLARSGRGGLALQGGTPSFMAPEQFAAIGHQRRLSPSVDLYALGCVIHWLARGQPPFTGKSWEELAESHHHSVPPTLGDDFIAPKGFGDFVSVLLAKQPEHRFLSAAHASRALAALEDRQLPPADRLPSSIERLLGAGRAIAADDATQRRPSSSDVVPMATSALAEMPSPVLGTGSIPSTWEAPYAGLVRSLRLHDAGLALHAVRNRPFVGRHRERTLLWNQLVATERAHLVVVSGDQGVGKTALLQWFATRARESGVSVAEACHHSPREHGDGLLAALEEELGDGAMTTGNGKDALVRALRRHTRHGPAIITIDNALQGEDTVLLVRHVLQHAPELPVMMVASTGEVPADWQQLQRCDIVLAELGRDDHASLCAELLGGPSSLAEELAWHSAGNALLATKAVHDWVAQGRLVASERGLAWSDPLQPVALPVSFAALCAEQINEAVRRHPDAAFGLVIGALLGHRVAVAEVDMALSMLPWPNKRHVRAMPGLWAELTRRGVVVPVEEGHRFLQAIGRSTAANLETRLDGHLIPVATLHRACAEAIALLFGSDAAFTAARRARHLAAAGNHGAAARLFLTATDQALMDGDIREAIALLGAGERAAIAAPAAVESSAVWKMMLESRVASANGQWGRAMTQASLAAQRTSTTETHLAASAWRVAGAAAIEFGDLDGAGRFFLSARQAAANNADALGVALAWQGLGDVAFYRGRSEDAEQAYLAGAEDIRSFGTAAEQAQLMWSLGYIDLELGRFANARRSFQNQLEDSRRSGDASSVANALNALGELARRTGQLDQAMEHYLASERQSAEHGHTRRWLARLNQAQVLLARGQYGAAARIVREIMATQLLADHPRAQGLMWWVLVVDASARGDSSAYDEAMAYALAVDRSCFAEYDFVVMADLAAAMQPDAQRRELARAFADRQRHASQPLD